MRGIWAMVMAGAACGGGGGGGGGGAGNDAPSGGDGAAADAPPLTVHGVASTLFVADSGSTTVPVDLVGADLSSISGSGDVTLSGVGGSDGTFEVPLEPGATSWFVGFGNLYLGGAVEHPDFGSVALGRSDAVAAGAGTTVTLNATGLSPWGARDDLELMSSNAGAVEFSPQLQFGTKPGSGDTSITAQSFAWTGNLVDATEGDDVIAWQLATATSGAVTYAGLANAGAIAGVTQASGTASTMTVAMQPVAQHALAITWQRDAFEALAATAGSGAVDAPTNGLFVDALPDLAQTSEAALAPDLVELAVPDGSGDVVATLEYGNPFATGGSAWDEFLFVKYQFLVPLLAPGAVTPATQIAGGVEQVPVTSLVGGVVAPVVTGVQDFTVDGKDAAAPRAGIGLTPTLAWSAPTTGADAYGVEIFRVVALAGGSHLGETATFFTHDTSLRVPAGQLAAGDSYSFKILSLKSPNDLVVTPFVPGPLAFFEVVSAVMQP